MELADRFDLPVLTFVDTAGAYPGIEAEERGQAEAIARSTDMRSALGVPNVVGGHRRGRLGRRHRDRHRQQGADAGARDLQRDLAGGRRLDPVARSGPRAGRRHQHEDHRPGPAAPRRHRRASSPEPTGGAHREPQAAISGGRRGDRGRPAATSATWARPNCATTAPRSSWRSAASCDGRPHAGAIATGCRFAPNFAPIWQECNSRQLTLVHHADDLARVAVRPA